jgi:hypothetical protein
VCGDFSGDGRVDVFVANDGRVNRLWINAGDGRFEEQAMLRGCAMDQDGKAKAGMGVTAADLEGDGDLDLLVCNLGGESDSLYLNQGAFFGDGGGSRGSAGRAGPSRASAWGGRTSTTTDGSTCTRPTGGSRAAPIPTTRPTRWPSPTSCSAAGRRGASRRSSHAGGRSPCSCTPAAGRPSGTSTTTAGSTVVVVNRDAAPYVLRNARSPRGHWLLVRVLDEHGRDALGATVTIRIGPGP